MVESNDFSVITWMYFIDLIMHSIIAAVNNGGLSS